MKLDEFKASESKLAQLGFKVDDGSKNLNQAFMPQSFAEGDIIESLDTALVSNEVEIAGEKRTVIGVACKITNKASVSRTQVVAYNTLTGSLIMEKNALTTAPRKPRFAALFGAQFEEARNENGELLGRAFPFSFKVKIDQEVDAFNTVFQDGSTIFEDENGAKHYRTTEEPTKKGISTGANLIKH